MTSATEGLPLDDLGPTRDVLARQVEALLHAWEHATEPPSLANFVPEGPAALRRLALIELIKVDLEYRLLRRHLPARLEDYLAAFPELEDEGLPSDLLYEEMHLRQRAGEPVTVTDYHDRFPTRVPELARLLDGGEPTRSTAAFCIDVPTHGVEPGRRLDDFDLLTRLGEGGFAQVFLARQRSMQRLVALKVSADRGSEPQTLAQLDHPHIVRVYDQRLLPQLGLRLLYMPYVPGGTLASVLDHVRRLPAERRDGRAYLAAIDAALSARGELPPAESALRRRLATMSWPAVVCWLGVRLADALAYAQAKGVLHRDVKPANVLLTGEGRPLLADFNVGSCTKLEGVGPAAVFGGSTAYMAPEHLDAFNPDHPRKADSLDGRCDLYALGMTLWELLTGERPFVGERILSDRGRTMAALASGRRAGVPPEADAQLPKPCLPGLANVLRTCLAPRPEDRFASAAELARELDLCLHPAARTLMTPAPGSWRALARRRPITLMLLMGLVPNALASLFNIAYNKAAIIDALPGAEEPFRHITLFVNGIFFPLATLFFVRYALPVARGLRAVEAGQPLPAAEAARLRRRCLRLGEAGVALSLGGWLTATALWPIALDLALYRTAGQHLPVAALAHFLASLTVCGLIAAAYPFFLVTALEVRAFYPPLARAGPLGPEDAEALARLGRSTGPYLVLAAAVPLLAVAALALLGLPDREAVGTLAAAGLVGFGLAFVLERRIRADLAALRHVVRPAEGEAGD